MTSSVASSTTSRRPPELQREIVPTSLGPGTRIPAILVSPHTIPGTIDLTEFETTSILKFIAERFQLDPLPNSRFHAVKSLARAFDFAAR